MPDSREPQPGGAGILPAFAEVGTWYSRGYLPHFERGGQVQMITFRLSDSFPATAVTDTTVDDRRHTDAARRQQLEALLDLGEGACHLRDKRLAKLVEDALLHFDGVRYRLLAWVVMPNHVHVLLETSASYPIAAVVHSWKSFTGTAANRVLGRKGVFWQREYFDRAIRDERHLLTAIDYIESNPCKAGLADEPLEWPFSSASRRVERAGRMPAPPES